MEHANLLLKIFLSSVLFLNVALAQVDDDNCYTAVFTEGTTDCSEFENKAFLCNLNIDIAPESEESDSGIVLAGDMEVMEDFEEEYDVQLNIWKDIGAGKQFMYSIEGNLCDSMKKNDTPWYPLVQALHTECPVKKGVYSVDNLAMSLEFAKNVLNHEFCGDYIVEISIGTIENPISCYKIGVAIEEVSCE